MMFLGRFFLLGEEFVGLSLFVCLTFHHSCSVAVPYHSMVPRPRKLVCQRKVS